MLDIATLFIIFFYLLAGLGIVCLIMYIGVYSGETDKYVDILKEQNRILEENIKYMEKQLDELTEMELDIRISMIF